MDKKAFDIMIEGLEEVQKESNNMDWLMEKFLKNSFGNIPQSEAMKKLKKCEQGE
jgi:hypothetical protein